MAPKRKLGPPGGWAKHSVHPDAHGPPKGELDRQSKYAKASYRAEVASNKAQNTGTIADHRAAAGAHRAAGIAAGKVGPELKAYQIEHRNQAGFHHAVVEQAGMSQVPKAHKPGTYIPTARDHEVLRNSQNKGTFQTFEEAHAKRYEAANQKAGRASSKASASGSAADHKSAAQAHRTAAGMANKADLVGNQLTHSAAAKAHDTIAKEGGKANLAGTVMTGPDKHGISVHPRQLHPTNLGAKVTPQVPAMKGTSPMGFSRGAKDEHAQTLSARANQATNAAHEDNVGEHRHASGLHIKAAAAHKAAGNTNQYAFHREAAAAHQGAAADAREIKAYNKPKLVAARQAAIVKPPHTEASLHTQTRANALTAKAQARPSLASHSLAASAHQQAAMHGPNDGAYHIAKANEHRAAAREHSHRIQKLKKLGPGQKHGAGGKFVGVPGGAK